MKNLKYIPLLLLILFINSCGPSTSITSSYKEPEVSQANFKKIFIVAMTDRVAARQTVETNIAQLLSTRGVAALKSVDKLPPGFRTPDNHKDKDLILQKIREANCDGIMTIALVDEQHETRYVPGTTYYPTAYPYYGAFGSYYAYGYNSFSSPGYYTNDKIYFLEANLYDANTEKLVWSAQSKTYNPESLNSFLKGYSKALAEQMNKDGIMMTTADKK